MPNEPSNLSHEEPPNKTRGNRYHYHNDGVRLVAPGQLHGFSLPAKQRNLGASWFQHPAPVGYLRSLIAHTLQASRDLQARARAGWSKLAIQTLGDLGNIGSVASPRIRMMCSS
jgi:hypothetical protein